MGADPGDTVPMSLCDWPVPLKRNLELAQTSKAGRCKRLTLANTTNGLVGIREFTPQYPNGIYSELTVWCGWEVNI
ncbi:hypothetical protein ElyMa_003944800 [Elysia marginata]|uniref:CUB domain-containing protein n=1 Tax=Elysia marginata TaxID=1093978 RepID=A0AAV4FT28_9GAST|nr:hypothetical protein ElyMa_003944800 [Elysia marginata]